MKDIIYFQRLKNFCKWYLRFKAKEIIIMTVCIICITVIYGILHPPTLSIGGSNYVFENWCLFMIMLLPTISIGRFMSILSSKGKRQTFFSFKATNTEKYIAAIGTSLIISIIYIYGLIVGDIIRVVIQYLYITDDDISLNLAMPKMLWRTFIFLLGEFPHIYDLEYYFATILFYNRLILFWISLYLLGGMLFRKMPFSFTSAILIIFSLCFRKATRYFEFHMWSDYYYVKFSCYIFMMALTIATVFNIWLSFRLLKRLSLKQM